MEPNATYKIIGRSEDAIGYSLILKVTDDSHPAFSLRVTRDIFLAVSYGQLVTLRLEPVSE